jgi:hypothetical protein
VILRFLPILPLAFAFSASLSRVYDARTRSGERVMFVDLRMCSFRPNIKLILSSSYRLLICLHMYLTKNKVLGSSLSSLAGIL